MSRFFLFKSNARKTTQEIFFLNKSNPNQTSFTSQCIRQSSNNSYLTTDDRDLIKKQRKFPKLTSQIYVQTEEVKQNDGFSLIESDTPAHELHLIKKTRSVVGEPWWIKKALKTLGFNGHARNEWKVIYTIQPNTTEVNNMLMQCKHMFKILPVKFVNGYPTEADIEKTQLNLDTGEMRLIDPIDYTHEENLKVFEINGVPVTEDLQTNSSFPLDHKELHRAVHRQKQLGQLNAEYTPTVYDYKYGQDLPGVTRLKGRADTSVKEDELNNN